MSDLDTERDLRDDISVYGNAFARRLPDGRLERIPPKEWLLWPAYVQRKSFTRWRPDR